MSIKSSRVFVFAISTLLAACSPKPSNESTAVWRAEPPATPTQTVTSTATAQTSVTSGAGSSSTSTAPIASSDTKVEIASKPGDTANGASRKPATKEDLKTVPENQRVLSPDELKHQQVLSQQVLDPNRFRTAHWQDKPMVPAAYEIAKSRPDMLERLFCYCGCDLTEKHRTLLDCFTDKDEHGSTCSECIDEAFLANTLYKKGSTMARIQEMVDEEFCTKYPFPPSERTQTYRNYLARRLYTASTEPSCGDNYRKEE